MSSSSHPNSLFIINASGLVTLDEMKAKQEDVIKKATASTGQERCSSQTHRERKREKKEKGTAKSKHIYVNINIQVFTK